MELAKALLLFFVSALIIVMGIAVLLRGYKKLNNVLFFLVALSMAGWSIGVGAFLLVDSAGPAVWLAKIFYAFPLLIGFALFNFAVSFPDYKRFNKPLAVFTGLGFVALLILLFAQEGFIVVGLEYHAWGKEVILNHAHYGIYALYLMFCFVGTLGLMFYKKTHEKGIYASQAALFFYGFLFTFFVGVIFNLFLPWFGNYRLIWIGPNCIAIFTSAIAYNIVRHKMFDVRLVVARTVAYLLLISTLTGAYTSVVFLSATQLFVQDSVFVQKVVPLLAALFLAATAPYFKKLFDRLTNRFFYRDAYEPQAFLDQLNKTLVSNIQLGILLREATQVIQENIKCEVCLIGVRAADTTHFRTIGSTGPSLKALDMPLLHAEVKRMAQKIVVTEDLTTTHARLQRMLNRHDIALVASLSSYEAQHLATAYLILGPKKSGNVYDRQDMRILEIIADELEIAIQNALRYEEIQGFATTLQNKVNHATSKLKQSNDKLKELDEAKDDFISMASHQLRTPLTSVKGYLSLVMEGDAGNISPQQKEMLNQALLSSQRMVYIIADLLNVSRLRTGKFMIDPSPVRLDTLIGEEITQLQDIAESRSVKLHYAAPKNFPELMLDKMKISQIIMNFIDNAIYYTPSGGRIDVELVAHEKTIELRVKDTGIGVPRHEQAHLFTKFYRAANARQARPDGTGLGLFMAKKVIIAQGGALIFESKEGKGSTFGFVFSRAKLALPTPKA